MGPNGAGKTTLLNLAVGLLAPTCGSITVLAGHPGDGPAQLEKVGFVAQDTPAYAGLSVAKHLLMGSYLNANWNQELARDRIDQLGLDPRQKAGSLSGGQRAQLALTMAIAKQPALLLLDEPVASLDPLVRREFLQGLMEIVAKHEVNVVLSSHLIADLERVCERSLPSSHEVIEESHTDKQSTFLVRTDQPILDPAWTVKPITLDELVLAYMGRARNPSPGRRSGLGVVS